MNSISRVKTPSNQELPRTGWKTTQLPDRWKEDKDWEGYQGGAWYKLDWSWYCKNNARLAEPIALYVDYIIKTLRQG